METATQFIEKALENCSDDELDAIINSLSQLQIGESTHEEKSIAENTNDSSENWIELLMDQMTSSETLDEARSRASKLLESFRESIRSESNTTDLNRRFDLIVRDNSVLKRAVIVLHRRQKDKSREFQILEQQIAEYREQLRVLEVTNYALNVHLQKALQDNPVLVPCDRSLF